MSIRKIKWLRRAFRFNYTVDDLKTLNEIPASTLRDSSKIVIVDNEIDKMQTVIESLRNNGYNVQTRTDVTSVSDIAPYDIVISDIQGVGQSIDSVEEGYGFIRQVSNLYPLKGIGVYSGVYFALKEPIEGMMLIQKDDSIQTWTENLDAKLRDIKDPAKMWKWIGKKLCENNVPSIVMAKIEDDYVDRVINNKSMDGFPSDRISDDSLMNILNLAVRTISLSVTASRLV